MIYNIRHFVELGRFVEAIYFGTLQLKSERTAQLHLDLGLACCGVIQPIAELQRRMTDLNNYEQNSSYVITLIIGNDTLLVYEGLQHLTEAISMNHDIQYPESMYKVVREVIKDLGWYINQEFHGYSSQYCKYPLKTSAVAATILLAKLIGAESELPSSISNYMKDSANRLLDELMKEQFGDASFYNLIK